MMTILVDSPKNIRSPAEIAQSHRSQTKRSKSSRGMDLSQYRKIIIYVLTFLAYAWSGYGAGLLSNLRDAVLAAESVFQDLFTNAITVARKIKDIHEVFDAAVEENCVFQCPDGAYIYICEIIYHVIRLSLHRAPPLVDSDRFGALCTACTFYTSFLFPLFLLMISIRISIVFYAENAKKKGETLNDPFQC